MIDSLPDRPLKRAEVDALDQSDSIHSVFPIYSAGRAYGAVLVTDGAAYAIVYEDGEWIRLDREAIDTRLDGVAWSNIEVVDELQEQIATRLEN